MLEVQNAKKYFGGVKAVDDVSLTVKRGSITGLIGANGAGKTTLFNVISGFCSLDGGKIFYQGESIGNLPPYVIAGKGIVRTFQTPKGFPKMTVMENMLVFVKDKNSGIWPAISARKKIAQREQEYVLKAREILNHIGMENKENSWVSELSAGELKLLEFVRPLMAEPQVFLLDEPAAGINPANLCGLIDLIQGLSRRGYTFLIVDHNLKFIMSICDFIYVMADGRLICSGVPEEVAHDERVIESYIGKKGTGEEACFPA
ncbi:ABC transporter ATP-binding protein [Candidatus Formimonas warabiya]|uniref:ABC transporter domain-containing protein n=1 Tax=Formimonas warabiya TaxID=1761012 RepID=A0A3G1KZE0_FORW1|nr:ABC transporter ATP-binding protein [Candidatus Formimonas warabiya]ATW27759.1 hypothetical protein DCMF_26080 [Candidatus Formimonas warabiya]